MSPDSPLTAAPDHPAFDPDHAREMHAVLWGRAGPPREPLRMPGDPVVRHFYPAPRPFDAAPRPAAQNTD